MMTELTLVCGGEGRGFWSSVDFLPGLKQHTVFSSTGNDNIEKLINNFNYAQFSMLLQFS